MTQEVQTWYKVGFCDECVSSFPLAEVKKIVVTNNNNAIFEHAMNKKTILENEVAKKE